MAFSNLEKLLGAYVGIDLVRSGASRRAVMKAVESALTRVAPAVVAPKPVAPAPVGFLGPASAITGATLTAGSAMDQAVADAQTTPNVMVPIPGLINPLVRDMPTIELPVTRRAVSRKLTKYNQAVKAGMKAVRSSTSYGKKGTINNAKKAFAQVNKVASKVKRGGKVSAKGITGKIARAVRKKL